MALNAASHNPTGEATGPVSGPPPPVSAEITEAITKAQQSDPLGQHAGGKDGDDQGAEKKVKSEKELEKERKKAEKAKKFAEKQAKTKDSDAFASKPAASKTKEKKASHLAAVQKEDVLPEYVEETPPGQKKILKPLDDNYHKAYIPKVVESAWYSWWEKEGFFKPEFGPDGKVKEEGYFAIPEPPPNVTGRLHLGHALTNALQDSLIRWSRMHGKTTLLLPGCDHAGISTQSVIENMLWRKEGKTRHDLGRPAFMELAWNWKDEYQKNINDALRRLGSSFDWSREAFTMDENLSKAVMETFVRLHDEGIIYRANRLVSWCVKLNTALSNLEVDNKELEGRTLLDVPGYDRKVEFGVLTHFCYPIDGSDEKIEVATTRPETMLGDTGIAVNPTDTRYKHLVGKYAKHPFVDRLLPIFEDEYVDKEFGTGAVKITPAHDPNDFTLGQRHNLEFINILNDNGTMNHNTGKFAGTKRFDARYGVITALKEVGLYVKWENNPMKVPLCSKSKDVIEPIMKPQWWMKMQGLADEALKAVRNGEIKFRPESAEKSFFRWLEGITDWCLSRQLWWGHQVPAYFVQLEGETSADESQGDMWVCGRTEEEAQEKAAKKFAGKKFTLRRDEDVLDTWFSSGLWPWSTLGWPNKTHDFENLYPQSLLETGWDIIFFWVARMIMLGIKMTGSVPFKEVYCHTLVRDSEGRKMSKSLGNVIDPLDVMDGIDLQSLHDKLMVGNLDPKEVVTATRFQKTSFPDGIPECGADALRFSLANYTTGNGDINFDIKVMHGYRKFCNKIYQATKFVLSKLPPSFEPQATPTSAVPSSLAEKWILHKMNTAAKEIDAAFTEREFSVATGITYQYWYTHLCDVYIENSKSLLADEANHSQVLSAQNTLYTALEAGLTMIHPFMPFLTEELWQRLPRRPDDKCPSIMKAKYPIYNPELDDPASEKAYELILEVTKGIRSLLASYNIKTAGTVYIHLFEPTAHTTCEAQLSSIYSLAGQKSVSEIRILSPQDEKPAGCVVAPVNAEAAVYLHVKGREDFDVDKEVEKVKKRLDKAIEGVKRQKGILGAEGYKEKVGEELQVVERRRLKDAEREVGVLEESLGMFERLKLDG